LFGKQNLCFFTEYYQQIAQKYKEFANKILKYFKESRKKIFNNYIIIEDKKGSEHDW